MSRGRWALVIAAVCLVVTAAAIVYAAGQATAPVQEVLRAQRLELVDAKGRVRGTFRSAADGHPALALLDEDGRARLVLALDQAGQPSIVLGGKEGGPPHVILSVNEQESGESGLSLLDADCKHRAMFALGTDGNAYLSLTSEDMNEVIRLSVGPGGTEPQFTIRDKQDRVRFGVRLGATEDPELVLYDENRMERAGLGLDADGRSSLELCDKKGKVRAALRVVPDGTPALALFAEQGEGGAMLLVPPASGTGLSLRDEKGEPRARLSLLADGSPQLVLSDSEGKVIFSAPDTRGAAEAPARARLGASLFGPLGTSDVIESHIDGDFEGWTGETIFKLENGQIWQQAEYAYTYHYAYSPEVLIYRTAGGYKMKVEGVEDVIRVEQLK